MILLSEMEILFAQLIVGPAATEQRQIDVALSLSNVEMYWVHSVPSKSFMLVFSQWLFTFILLTFARSNVTIRDLPVVFYEMLGHVTQHFVD